MASNSLPIFTKNGRFAAANVTAANTSSQGGGTIATDIFLVITADATNGTFVESIDFMPTATAPTNTTATVGRVFVSSQASGATTTANTHLWREVALPLVAADNATAAVNPFSIPFRRVLPAGMSILVTNHAAPAANTNWKAVATGGDY